VNLEEKRASKFLLQERISGVEQLEYRVEAGNCETTMVWQGDWSRSLPDGRRLIEDVIYLMVPFIKTELKRSTATEGDGQLLRDRESSDGLMSV